MYVAAPVNCVETLMGDSGNLNITCGDEDGNISVFEVVLKI